MGELRYDNFLGLEPRYSDYKKSKYALLPIPYDATTSFQGGTRNGPRAILTASQQVELFDEEFGREFHQIGIHTLDSLAANASGPEAMHGDIFNAAKRAVRDGKFLIGLGGEHSVTSALIKAVKTRHKQLSVLQIDAHADLRDQYEGTPYSHASVMRRVLEMGVSIVPVGIRNYSLDEHKFMKKHGFSPISARETRENPQWIEQAVSSLTDNVYVTIDIDGFDPAYAPGTGTPEPGGLDWFQVTDLIRAVALEKTIVGADVVEVAPQPGSVQTEFLAAKLVYKLISQIESTTK
ncbi:MAG: agmatinase [Phycisphaerales bacterium]|nr:agmatinase [Phycisphaerales bacterium]MCB9858703.1 agmatinase [Phycisphaerales bacterium]MCB9864441.1 agmatinase [Phycisphaerales bacterium]